MYNPRMHSTSRRAVALLIAAFAPLAAPSGAPGGAPSPVTITVDAGKPGPRIDPMFYGLMTEEINFSYDGGLYAELIRNRAFKDDAKEPIHWSLVKDDGAEGTIALSDNAVPNTALTAALKLDVTSASSKGRVGVANEGYWGIPVKPDTPYRVSFWAMADNNFSGPLTLSIESNDGATTWAMADTPPIANGWKKYTATLKTAKATPSTTNRFVLSAHSTGTVWLSLVSLFPPTYKDRPNGNRADIMELLAAMKPKFLRFPGGNYLEGPDYDNRFNWKATIGPLEQRPTHMSPWRYRSSDGMGLLEFLEWSEDLGMEPLLAVYAGLHIDRGANILTGDALKPHVQDALDEIEYVTGDAKTTTWGFRRAKDGHPKPFPLRYVEIGNEDWLNNGTASYDSRFTMFYDAIKAKYPSLKIISTFRTRDTTFVHSRPPDLLDDHFYVTIPTALSQAHLYDNYSRSATKVFVGEWATNAPTSGTRTGDTPMMAYALGDAAWLTGLERNADVIVMNCYAPLFVNVNPGGRQWAVNLIGYDALTSFGSPSYYVQKMFSTNRGDVVLPATIDPLPKLSLDEIPKAPPGPPPPQRAGAPPPAPGRGSTGPEGPFDGIYVSATREDASGDVILKLVNVQASAQAVRIVLKSVRALKPEASGEVLAGELTAMNTVAEPTKIAPTPLRIANAAPEFTHELPAHSVTVVRLHPR